MKSLQRDEWPLPMLRIDRDFNILEYSMAAQELIGASSSFLELLDEESRQKAQSSLHAGSSDQQVELNFIVGSDERFAADVYVKWSIEEQTASLAIVRHAASHERITEQFIDLRRRLNETNYDLLLEKMKVEELIERIRELSAPLIQLDESRVLIPLFGDLTAEQMMAVQEKVLSDTYISGATTIILDFTAVDLIDSSGLQEFDSILQSLSLMGTSVIMTGLHPEHAKRLNELQARLGTRFVSSLRDILH